MVEMCSNVCLLFAHFSLCGNGDRRDGYDGVNHEKCWFRKTIMPTLNFFSFQSYRWEKWGPFFSDFQLNLLIWIVFVRYWNKISVCFRLFWFSQMSICDIDLLAVNIENLLWKAQLSLQPDHTRSSFFFSQWSCQALSASVLY